MAFIGVELIILPTSLRGELAGPLGKPLVTTINCVALLERLSR